MKRWLKEIEENGEKRKIRRKERKERECIDEEKGYMIMKWWDKWDDIKWYWDEYLDFIVINENRNNGQIGLDGW